VSLLSFLGKVLLFLFVSVWIRASWPRVRYDWLMDLGWKWLLPLALVNLVITAVVIVLVPENQVIQGVILLALGLAALFVATRLGQSARVTSKVRMIQSSAAAPQQPVSSRQSEAKSS
jgi:NADH-quinone oxidoreductase subunit H